MKKKKNNKPIIVFTALLLVAMLLVSFFVISTTSEIGRKVGGEIGELIGRAKGTIEGTKKGEKDGLINPDTEVDIATEVKKCGYLQVLEMDINLADVFYIGGTDKEHKDHDYKNVKYAEYYTEDGIAIYKIDLSDAIINPKLQSNIVEVEIEKDIEISINPKTDTLKSVDTYQAHDFTDSIENGEAAFRNSYNTVVPKVKEALYQNESIMNEARKSAKTQVSNLVKAVCGSEVNIKFTINGIEVQD